MTRLIERDATNVILTVIVLDSDGAAIPNIEWNDPDRAIHWRASASGSWTEITRSEGTIGTWSSGGWVHLGGGVYQLGLPNAAVVAGDRTTVRLVYDTHPPQYAAIDAVLYPSVDVSSDVSAIKAKTDNLPASPAAVGSAMTLTPGERTSISDSVWTRGTRTITTAIPTANQTRDAVWAASSRTLTANPGLDAAGMRSALGMSSANHDAQIVDILDAIGDIPGGGGGLDAAGIRAAMGLATDNLDIQLAGIVSDIAGIGGGGGGGGLTKADVRDAIGLTDPDLGDQLADILEAISDIEVGGELADSVTLAIPRMVMASLNPAAGSFSMQNIMQRDATDIRVFRGTRWVLVVQNVGEIDSGNRVYLTMKSGDLIDTPDDDAVVQIVGNVSGGGDGLVRLNGDVATGIDGSVSYQTYSESGEPKKQIVIVLEDVASTLVAPGRYRYDVKSVGEATTVLDYGWLEVMAESTREVSE